MTHPVRLHKRWLLREGVTADDVAALVRDRVAPHYARLHPDVVLGLERPDDSCVVALQTWPSPEVLAAATTGPAYDAWWQEYLPVLADWDALVTFDAEWESTVLR